MKRWVREREWHTWTGVGRTLRAPVAAGARSVTLEGGPAVNLAEKASRAKRRGGRTAEAVRADRARGTTCDVGDAGPVGVPVHAGAGCSRGARPVEGWIAIDVRAAAGERGSSRAGDTFRPGSSPTQSAHCRLVAAHRIHRRDTPCTRWRRCPLRSCPADSLCTRPASFLRVARTSRARTKCTLPFGQRPGLRWWFLEGRAPRRLPHTSSREGIRRRMRCSCGSTNGRCSRGHTSRGNR